MGTFAPNRDAAVQLLAQLNKHSSQQGLIAVYVEQGSLVAGAQGQAASSPAPVAVAESTWLDNAVSLRWAHLAAPSP